MVKNRKEMGADVLFIVKQTMERKLEFDLESFWNFVDLEGIQQG